jgi:hypothetical protein
MPKKEKPVKRILNCSPSQKTEKDWEFTHAIKSELIAAPGPIPGLVDLRNLWWNIGDQEATGSCVGWATADSVLRYHFVKAGRLPESELLSVRYIWMAAKELDEFVSPATTFIEEEGTSLKAALDVARKYGVVLNKTLPFDPPQLYPGDEKTFYALAAKLKITAYFNLRTNLANWRTWLATQGPILTRLSVDATWDNATETQGNLDTYQSETERGGHAVALVGYTSDRFIVRNSWGTQWGDKGFGYASMAYAQAAFTEAYGVSVA